VTIHRKHVDRASAAKSPSVITGTYAEHSAVQFSGNCSLREKTTTIWCFWAELRRSSRGSHEEVLARAVRRRRAAADADRMSASRRRRFCDVFTSRCTPAICC